jgi:thiol-disulfide isomerase/thioredoxin
MPEAKKLMKAMLAMAALSYSIASAPAQGAAQAWYADGLKKLGFTVFAKPLDLEDFAAKTLAGSSASLGAQRGKVVLLNFWATWCPPCQAEMPAIEALWKKNKDKAFTVMGVSVGEAPGTVKDYIARKGYTYPVYLDQSGAIGSAFGARSIPTTYVVDKAGKAIAGIVGGAPYDGAEALALFAELAAR